MGGDLLAGGARVRRRWLTVGVRQPIAAAERRRGSCRTSGSPSSARRCGGSAGWRRFPEEDRDAAGRTTPPCAETPSAPPPDARRWSVSLTHAPPPVSSLQTWRSGAGRSRRSSSSRGSRRTTPRPTGKTHKAVYDESVRGAMDELLDELRSEFGRGQGLPSVPRRAVQRRQVAVQDRHRRVARGRRLRAAVVGGPGRRLRDVHDGHRSARPLPAGGGRRRAAARSSRRSSPMPPTGHRDHRPRDAQAGAEGIPDRSPAHRPAAQQGPHRLAAVAGRAPGSARRRPRPGWSTSCGPPGPSTSG